MITKFKSRKFILGVILLSLATVIFVFTDGKLSGDNWVDLVKWVSGFYFVANAASKWGRRDG